MEPLYQLNDFDQRMARSKPMKSLPRIEKDVGTRLSDLGNIFHAQDFVLDPRLTLDHCIKYLSPKGWTIMKDDTSL